ncbi:MAG: uridylate kinase [Chloroflexi bacterium HGW-Chloroflexi-1]|nr:MAG: uridylate kinase [Chloroflexi bacterium HGW-Chloroflexi-1]
MNELVFLKLGGSLLTDKTRPRALRADVLTRLAAEIAGALADRPGLRLLIGHGSGSFGHVIAREHGTRDGVTTPAGWRGYAETASVAAELNRLVVGALWDAGVPALPVQPSASARCRDGVLIALEERPLRAALASGLAPVVYGDVALDDVRGGAIISTEEIFRWLAPRLEPNRVVLVGDVAGVLTADPTSGTPTALIDEITPDRLPALMQVLGGSRGVDVTGGMAAKVAEMMALVQTMPGLAAVQIISGLEPDLVRAVLADPHAHAGTRITR